MATKKNYDSDFCGSLPLNLVNMIQPYGYLLVLNRDLEIVQASENVADLLARPIKEIVPSSFSTWLEPGSGQSTLEKIGAMEGDKGLLSLRLAGNATEMFAIVHPKEDLILVELEPVQERNQFIDVFQHLKPSMTAIEQAGSVSEACAIAVDELKKLSGFDKVMVYSFDSDWNGTVLAEAMEPGMDAYLGLKFPASDVPKQARQLYQKNPFRLIPDREYQAVSLYPVINHLKNSFIDLSECNLRGVASVHLEYLANMNVMSSMSTRILIDGKLWGLISCHHRQAKNPGYEMCATFELMSGYIATKIASICYQEEAEHLADMQSSRLKILEAIYSYNSLYKGLLEGEVTITDLLNAGGAAVYYQGSIATHGNTPGPEDLENLQFWLQSRNLKSVLSIASLSEVYEDAAEYYKEASGMLVIPINLEKNEFIVLFRPEVVQTVQWGGNPDEAIQFENDKKKYHPRNSFKIWKETVHKRAEEWTESELAVADELKNFTNEYSKRDFG